MILEIKDKEILIDDEDYEKVKDYKWVVSKHGTHFYVSSRKQVDNVSKITYMHRLIMNTPKGMFTDHINGNTFDNRKCNLRVCTSAQNNRNQTTQTRPKFSKYKGVTRDKSAPNRFVSSCKHKGKLYRSYWSTEKEAALEYNRVAKELFGEFARPNVIEED